MRSLTRLYLQHASRHLPQGSDPIPGLITSVDQPSAIFEATGVPITNFATSSTSISLDTFSANSVGAGYFDTSGGTALLQAGFYLAVGFIEFFTFADWSADTDRLSVGFELSFGSPMTIGLATTGSPTEVISLTVVDILNLSVPVSVALSVGVSASSINPLPSDLVAAKAGFVRMGGSA